MSKIALKMVEEMVRVFIHIVCTEKRAVEIIHTEYSTIDSLF